MTNEDPKTEMVDVEVQDTPRLRLTNSLKNLTRRVQWISFASSETN